MLYAHGASLVERKRQEEHHFTSTDEHLCTNRALACKHTAQNIIRVPLALGMVNSSKVSHTYIGARTAHDGTQIDFLCQVYLDLCFVPFKILHFDLCTSKL